MLQQHNVNTTNTTTKAAATVDIKQRYNSDAPLHSRRYTLKERKAIEQLYLTGVQPRFIAKAFGRTNGAISSQLKDVQRGTVKLTRTDKMSVTKLLKRIEEQLGV